MRSFRLILTLISFLACPIMGDSQNLIYPYFEQNKEMKDFDSCIADSSEITIYSVENCPEGYWKIAVSKNGQYEDIEIADNKNSSCKFRPSDIDWYQASRQFDVNSGCDLFKVRIQYITTGSTNVKYIFLSLLPSRPRLSNISFTYTYNWEGDYINPDSEFSFDVSSKRADSFSYFETASYLFPCDDMYFIIIENYKTPEELHINYNLDWGTYICMKAENQFGYVYGDTICTTSYIKDEAILKRLRELAPTGINELHYNNNSNRIFVLENNIISFNSKMKRVQFYNSSGIMCLNDYNIKSIDISHLLRGLYFVRYIGYDNISRNAKIFIQ